MAESMSQSTSYDEEEFYDAFNPEQLQQQWQINEQELLNIAGKIGDEWMTVGIILGYKSVTLNHLEQVYPKQPHFRNFVMIAKWCDVVSQLNLNVRLLLASAMFEAKHADIADTICSDYKDVKAPDTISRHVEHISFDKPIEKTLERYDLSLIESRLGQVSQVRFEMKFSTWPEMTMSATITEHQRVGAKCKTICIPEIVDTCSTERTNTERADIWALDKMASALPNSTNSKNKDMMKMVKDLSLESVFPSKITVVDVRQIRPTNIELCESELPWLLLSKLTMLNYSARESDLNLLYEKRKQNSDTQPDSDDELFQDTTVNSINPCDLLYLTFISCDQLLKLELISKLFTCRLAIPFIYRDSEGQMILSQWALRTILIEKRSEQKSGQMDALHHETKIVSFVRLGKQGMSKSKLINEVLCHRYHPVFFNRDCPLGTSPRKIANGVVEAAWFMPSGKDNDHFSELTMFLNLRGNCMEFTKELEVMCQLSHVIVIHINIKELISSREKAILSKIHQYNLPVVYALESDVSTHEQTSLQPSRIWKEYKNEMLQFKQNIKLFNLKASNQARSSSDITKDMRKILSEILANKTSSQLVTLVNKLGISDEELIAECKRSKKLALEVLSTISGNARLDKETILPLQGKVWSKLGVALKKLSKVKSDEEAECLNSELTLTRTEQIYKLKTNSHAFIVLLLKNLQSEQSNKQYFLTWIKLLLDEKSRSVLPQLLYEYQQLWLAMKSTVEGHQQDACTIKERVDHAEQELVDASFGLEHLIRELGQIYESTVMNSDFIDSWIYELPKLVSNLIQQGFPFEIMDGDTAMIPILWVGAVFKQLAADTGDNKILTISVLGIQSSGKSTLLNAMFGLQFAVSAGRCTRGVFAQLVKVTNRILPYEHVLVVDTEGLRAPELADQNHSHDNELATFVLGLGNITIINIKGENTAEMEDVLQIAVHAFLRLQMANMRLKLQQTCIFVHQNVPSIDASTKMTHARQKMMDKLDRLTFEAAKHEGLSDIYSFNQVLEINTESHMWYFSDFWSGDPPMAPVNIGYSENISEVRQKILFNFGVKKRNILSISETLSVMNDLWTGILSDNFVFSFRNSLEVKAYHLMETQFHKIIWGIEKEMQWFLQQEASIQIVRCRDAESLENLEGTLFSMLHHFLSEKERDGTESFNTFIDNCSLCNLMDQWRQFRIIHLHEYVKNLFSSGRQTIEAKKMNYAAELLSLTRLSSIEQELKTNAHDLAKLNKGKKLSSAEVASTFDGMWNKCISKFELENMPKPKPIKREVKDILFQLFDADVALLSKELKKVKDIEYDRLSSLKDSMTCDDLDDSHISVSKGFIAKMLRMSKKETFKKQAFILINTIFSKLDTYLSSLISDDKPFEKAHALEVFMLLKESLDSHNNGIGDYTKYTFTAALRIKLAVHVSMYVTVFFTKLDENYNTKHNVVAQIKRHKYHYFSIFTDEIKNKRDEQKLANLLQNAIEKIILNEIEKTLPIEVIKAIIDECFTTKYSLILSILKDLAMEEDFTQYALYIDDAHTFALKWITVFTKKYMFGKEVNRFSRIVNRLVSKYINIVEVNMRHATNFVKTHRKTCDWVNILEDLLCREMPIPFRSFHFATQFKNVNYSNLHACLQNQLPRLEKRLKTYFTLLEKEYMQWLGVNPYRAILNTLWGCKAKCPFCNEPCQKTSGNHQRENHTCIQHRPPGVRGVRVKHSNFMHWESCNYSVQAYKSFNCGAAGLQCRKSVHCSGKDSEDVFHEFRNYRMFIPDWDIEPSALEDTVKYWKWFIYKFRKELAEQYGYEVPRVVQKWKTITKKEAIDSLTQFTYER